MEKQEVADKSVFGVLPAKMYIFHCFVLTPVVKSILQIYFFFLTYQILSYVGDIECSDPNFVVNG